MPAKNGTTLRARAREFANGTVDDVQIERPTCKRRNARRLTDLDPKWREIMENLARRGRGVSHFKTELGLCHSALENLLRDEPEFFDHYIKCLDLQKAWMVDKGLDNLEKRDFNTPLWAMFMVNEHGWRSANSRAELAGDRAAPVAIEARLASATDAEINEQLGIPAD